MKSRRAKLEEQKCSPSAEGFFVRCAGPKGCAPLEPQGGCPPAPHALYTPSGGPAGAFAEGQGCRGRAPRHPAGRLGSLRSRQGAVSSPLRGCGPHQPLDPPFTEKRARGPRRGLRGTAGGMGVKARAATAQRLGLDAQERPPRSGLVAGVLFPSRLPRGERPRRPPEALLICSCFARFRETTKRAFRMRKDLSTDLRSVVVRTSLFRTCALRCFERAHFAVSNVHTSLFRTCTLRCFERIAAMCSEYTSLPWCCSGGLSLRTCPACPGLALGLAAGLAGRPRSRP